MNDTPFCALMGWEVTGFHKGRVNKVMLSDGTTEIPMNDRLKNDILAVIERAKSDSQPPTVSSIGSNAA